MGFIMNITDFKFAILEYTRKINENINKLFNPIFAEYGLTMLQGRILMELFHFGILSIGNLAESINVAGLMLQQCVRSWRIWVI